MNIVTHDSKKFRYKAFFMLDSSRLDRESNHRLLYEGAMNIGYLKSVTQFLNCNSIPQLKRGVYMFETLVCM